MLEGCRLEEARCETSETNIPRKFLEALRYPSELWHTVGFREEPWQRKYSIRVYLTQRSIRMSPGLSPRCLQAVHRCSLP